MRKQHTVEEAAEDPTVSVHNDRRPRIRTITRPSNSSWLSPKEGAAYLGVGVDCIYEACASKGLRHVKLGHSTIRLRREWIDAWAEAQAR